MKRVTIVNLAGTAWHVEEEAVARLDGWLADARMRLAGDPDVDELVADFQRAIADRLATHAPADRDVVTTDQVDSVLAALGPVEPADAAPAGDGDATATGQPVTAAAHSDRKIHRLAGGDSMLAGVCAGVAAYLNVDVTVVRVLWVLATFLTSGFGLLTYVVLAILLPEARTPEQRARAYGTGTTAQDMLARARAQTGPALASAGSVIGRIARITGELLRGAALVAMGILIIGWAAALIWLIVDGGDLLGLFDESTSAWVVGLWLTCVAWIPVSLLLLVERLTAAMLHDRPGRRWTGMLASAWTASFVLACIGVLAIPATSSEQLRDIAAGRQARIDLFGQEICITPMDGATASVATCRAGDGVRARD